MNALRELLTEIGHTTVNIVLAPDSYKDSLSSPDVCRIIAEAFRNVFSEASIASLPMADGGEGTLEATVRATGGSIRPTTATDPLGKPITARYGVLGDGLTGVIEMACASGLERLDSNQRNPVHTTSYGTGELIATALNEGLDDIIVAIGGSATVDGGTGMAQALGYRFLDDNEQILEQICTGETLGKISGIDASAIHPRLTKARIRVACDVENPLLGTNGAAQVFAPQKGANESQVDLLDKGLQNICSVWEKHGLDSSPDSTGAGAAGGLGAGLRAFCNASLVPGVKLVSEIVHLDEHIHKADIVTTGEGRTDWQTFSGKVCHGIAREAHNHNTPVILLSGTIRSERELLEKLAATYTATFSVNHELLTLNEALRATEEELYYTALNVARTLQLNL